MIPPVPVVGLLFGHARMLDTDWTPAPGQLWSEAPPMRCRVVKITRSDIYYRAADGRGLFRVARHLFPRIARPIPEGSRA